MSSSVVLVCWTNLSRPRHSQRRQQSIRSIAIGSKDTLDKAGNPSTVKDIKLCGIFFKDLGESELFACSTSIGWRV